MSGILFFIFASCHPLRNKQKYKYTNNMQVMLMRLMSKGEYLIVPKGTKFTGSGKLGLKELNIVLFKIA